MAAHQRVAHRVKNGLDGVFGIAVGELAKAGGQFFNKVRAGHGVNVGVNEQRAH